MSDDLVLLIDMVEHARQVREAMARLSRADFDRNYMLKMGIAHSLQIIGEAARLVSEQTRKKYTEIPWGLIVGMRHKIVHEYFRVDFDVVWDTATLSVRELLNILEPVIGPIIDSRSPQQDVQ